LVFQRDGVTVVIDTTQRLVHLDELTVWQPLDDAGLNAMLENCPVSAL
jgi:hypothetical protein